MEPLHPSVPGVSCEEAVPTEMGVGEIMVVSPDYGCGPAQGTQVSGLAPQGASSEQTHKRQVSWTLPAGPWTFESLPQSPYFLLSAYRLPLQS